MVQVETLNRKPGCLLSLLCHQESTLCEVFAIIVFQELAPLLELAVTKDGLPIRPDVVPILGMRTILASVFRTGRGGFSRFLCHSASGFFHP